MTTRIRFGTRQPLAPLLLKNLLLTVLTLGIYRFWAKTALRRHFWRSVKIDRRPFEYVGRGGELFVGFLIGVAVLAPLGAVQAGSQLLAGDPLALGLLHGATLVVLYALGHVARFQARRYRLSRTSWRGVRAGQDGSTWAYLGRALGWGLVGLATLGFSVPWGSTALQRYRTNATRFGDRRFAFAGGAGPLVLRWLPTWGAGLVAVGALIAAAVRSGPAVADPAAMTTAAAVAALALFVAAVAYIAYRTAMFRHFARCTALDGVGFESRARAGAMVQIAAIYVGAMFVLVVGLGMLVALGVLLFGEPIRGPIAAFLPQWAAAGIIVGLPGILLGHHFLWVMVVQVTVLEHLCETFTVQGLESLAAIAPSAPPDPRFGEGLADALDVGAV